MANDVDQQMEHPRLAHQQVITPITRALEKQDNIAAHAAVNLPCAGYDGTICCDVAKTVWAGDMTRFECHTCGRAARYAPLILPLEPHPCSTT